MNFGLDFGGIEIVKNLSCGFGWIHSWYMREILLACVNFISWTWQNFVGMEKFCEHGKILWVWDFGYGSINVGSWKIFVVILIMEIFWWWFWSWKIFWLWFWAWKTFLDMWFWLWIFFFFFCWAWKILWCRFWLWKYFCWVCELWHGEFLLVVGLYFCWNDFFFFFWYGLEFLTSWRWAKLCFVESQELR